MRRLRSWRTRESGFTLIEMTMSMVILSLALAALLPLLVTSTTSAQRTQTQSESIDNLRLALTAIGRELRSAQCITAPAENTTGTTLRFTTAANNSDYEVIYAVSGTKLTRQVVGNSQVTTAAEHLVSTADAFQQISTPRRTVVLTFRVQADPKNSPRVLVTTIAGRNAWRTCPAPLS